MTFPASRQLLKITVPILLSLSGVSLMALLTRLIQNGTIPVWHLWNNAEVDFTATLQLLMLPASLAVIFLIRVFQPLGFTTFFTIKIKNITEEAANWRVTGPMLAVVFTLGTTMFMSTSVIAQHGQMNAAFFRLLPLVALLAAMNAWTEEIFTRFVIVAGLYGKLPSAAVCWISALVFGLPHFFGTPSGIFGVVMAGLMGWLLATSMVATKSMTWALLIHFLQDLAIFGGGAMVLGGNSA